MHDRPTTCSHTIVALHTRAPLAREASIGSRPAHMPGIMHARTLTTPRSTASRPFLAPASAISAKLSAISERVIRGKASLNGLVRRATRLLDELRRCRGVPVHGALAWAGKGNGDARVYDGVPHMHREWGMHRHAGVQTGMQVCMHACVHARGASYEVRICSLSAPSACRSSNPSASSSRTLACAWA